MLGPIAETLGEICYVRSNPKSFWRHLLCQVQSQKIWETLVMLGPIAETLGDTCYGQVQSKKFLETLVMLGQIQKGLGDICYVSSNPRGF